jgi:hypothetical protein
MESEEGIVFSRRAIDRNGKDVRKMCKIDAELEGATSAGRCSKSGQVGRRARRKEFKTPKDHLGVCRKSLGGFGFRIRG